MLPNALWLWKKKKRRKKLSVSMSLSPSVVSVCVHAWKGHHGICWQNVFVFGLFVIWTLTSPTAKTHLNCFDGVHQWHHPHHFPRRTSLSKGCHTILFIVERQASLLLSFFFVLFFEMILLFLWPTTQTIMFTETWTLHLTCNAQTEQHWADASHF